jgi:hypothetical protein
MDREAVAREREWYRIRDALLGHNYVVRDVAGAGERASSSAEQRARRLSAALAGARSPEEARETLLRHQPGAEEEVGLHLARVISSNPFFLLLIVVMAFDCALTHIPFLMVSCDSLHIKPVLLIVLCL